MFHSQSLLSKNGALGNIWMAAFCFKKLKKQQIADTDITSSIEKIMPEVQISYRVLAQLLFGIVKIFSKKVDYLYHDCNEALTIVIRSLNPTVQRKSNAGPQNAQKKEKKRHQDDVDIAKEVPHAPEQNVLASRKGSLREQMETMLASYHDVTITLPESFQLDAFDLEVTDSGDSGKPNEQPIVEDGRPNERDQFSILNECRNTCFSPMDDGILSTMMDVGMSELYNSLTIEPRGEIVDGLHDIEEPKDAEGYLHDEHIENQVHSVNLQDKMISDTQRQVQNDDPKTQVDLHNLCSTKLSQCVESHYPTEGTSHARNLDEGNRKSNVPPDSGLPSPKLAVATPAKKEARRMSRKRKRRNVLFDDRVVLSNETMRNLIDDASNLVCKRRKAPHTSLDAWKFYTLTNLQQTFMERLIPYISPEHIAVLKKPSDLSSQKKLPSSSEILIRSGDSNNSFQGKIPADVNHSDISTPDRSEVRMRESSPFEVLASDLDIIDGEASYTENGSGEQDVSWSMRTRVVARFLHDRFVDLKEQKRTEILNLAQILEGQKRGKSARIFFETLILKGHGCIDVKQDSPFGEIILSPTPLLEALIHK